MKNNKEVGSYSWFREHGHDPLKALKRTIGFGLEGLVPFPRYGPREHDIDGALEDIASQLRYISRVDYNQNKNLSNAYTPEVLIMNEYDFLQKQPTEFFNERTRTEYKKLEERIIALQQEGKLPI